MKMLTKHVYLVIFIVFLKSKVWLGETSEIECDAEDIAVQHLKSYYNWFYRLTHFLYPFYYAKTLVCTMDEKQRRKVCAQVAKFCYFKHKEQITEQEIIEETTAGEECKKEDFEYKRPDGPGYKTSKKKMFLCPLVTKWGEQMSDVYISASNEINTVLVFQKKKDKIRLVHIVRNLNFETNDKPKKLVSVEIDEKPMKSIPGGKKAKIEESKPETLANDQ